MNKAVVKWILSTQWIFNLVSLELCAMEKKENCKTLNHNLNSVEWIEKKSNGQKKGGNGHRNDLLSIAGYIEKFYRQSICAMMVSLLMATILHLLSFWNEFLIFILSLFDSHGKNWTLTQFIWNKNILVHFSRNTLAQRMHANGCRKNKIMKAIIWKSL